MVCSGDTVVACAALIALVLVQRKWMLGRKHHPSPSLMNEALLFDIFVAKHYPFQLERIHRQWLIGAHAECSLCMQLDCHKKDLQAD